MKNGATLSQTHRRIALGCVVALIAGLFCLSDQQTTHATAQPVCRIASMPDGWNTDLGDLRQLDSWRRGFGNSTNGAYRRSMARILDDIAAQDPDAVLVAGDLVEGHWGADVQGTRFFGRVRSLQQRHAAIRRAGAFYYREWAERFAARSLRVFPAIGDHEIGDNPWAGLRGGYGAGNNFKRSAFGTFKDAWAKVFTNSGRRFGMRPRGTPFESTAYAVHPCSGVLGVTVDVFTRYGGDVHAELGAAQLRWLDSVLETSTTETVIVQGHTPVLGPVRKRHSSGLMYEGGKDSRFWQILAEHDVDFYFAGEVHDVTVLQGRRPRFEVPTTLQARGVVQISHGGLINHGEINYLVGEIDAHGGIELELRRFEAAVKPMESTLWATTWKRPNARVVHEPDSYVTGRMTVGHSGIAAESGELQRWDGSQRPGHGS